MERNGECIVFIVTVTPVPCVRMYTSSSESEGEYTREPDFIDELMFGKQENGTDEHFSFTEIREGSKARQPTTAHISTRRVLDVELKRRRLAEAKQVLMAGKGDVEPETIQKAEVLMLQSTDREEEGESDEAFHGKHEYVVDGEEDYTDSIEEG